MGKRRKGPLTSTGKATNQTIEDLRAENLHLRETLDGILGKENNTISGLTPTQTRIVRALQKARGRDVSIEALCDALYWDKQEVTGGPGAIHAHVCYIRKRRPDISQRLHAVRGFGYRLKPELAVKG